jgi:hypothetical protein
LVRKPGGKRELGRYVADGRIILKRVSNNVRMSIGFIWLRISSSGGGLILLWEWTFRFHKSW